MAARSTILVLIGALILAASVWPASPVDAHARLIAADPPSGSALAAPPAAFHLTFSEEIDARFSSAELRGGDGESLGELAVVPDARDPRAVLLQVRDPASITPGTYVVVWRVLSTLDGHVTTGVIAFSTGTGQVPAIAGAASEAFPPWWRLGIRWLKLGALLAVAGGWIYGVWVARPWRQEKALKQSDDAVGTQAGAHAWLLRCWRWQWFLAAAMMAIALILSLIDQAALASGDVQEAWSRATLQRLVIESRFGTSWLMLVALLLALVLLAQTGLQRRSVWLAGAALSMIALISLPLSGHAAAESRSALAIAVDWVHLAAAAGWLGGLAYLTVAVLTVRRQITADSAGMLAAMVDRFSWFALACVLALAVSGILNAIFHVAGMRSLTTFDYSTALIVKLGLLVAVLVAAALNRWGNLPRLRAAAASNAPDAARRAVSALGVTAIAELTLGSLLLIASATLTELPPADGPLPVNVAAKIVIISTEAVTGDLRVALQGTLNSRAGANGAPDDRLTIAISTLDGRMPSAVQRVIVSTAFAGTTPGNATLSDRFDAEPVAGSTGTFTFPAVRLGVHGPWDVTVTVRRAGVEDQQATLRVDTSGAAVPPPRTARDHWFWPRLTPAGWALLVLAVLAMAGGAVCLRFIAGLEPLAAALVLVMVALIAAGFTVSAVRQMVPVTDSTHLVNPVAAGDDSVMRGEALYRAYCLACHGAQGAGVETADPLHSHGSAADLTDWPSRSQRDGDLYHAITYGVPGTVMPAYDEALADQERWDLVNYLRALQGAPTREATNTT